MASYKNQPEVNNKLKLYDQYVEELHSWCIDTYLEKKKSGSSHCPFTNDLSGICGKAFHGLTLANLNNDTGVTTLITYLDGVFLRDELSEVYKCWIKLDHYVK